MVSSAAINQANTHGHACFFYHTRDERLRVLAQYLKEGLAKNELCVFVTADSEEDIIENFKSMGFDATESIIDGSLKIFEMNETYVPDGRFAADYMLHNVSSYIDDAKAQGYSGLRTAGEMSWMYEHPEAVADALGYEGDVNKLPKEGSNFIGLCLYPVQDKFSELFENVLRTHPAFIYDGRVSTNPYYVPSEDSALA